MKVSITKSGSGYDVRQDAGAGNYSTRTFSTERAARAYAASQTRAVAGKAEALRNLNAHAQKPDVSPEVKTSIRAVTQRIG